MTHNQGHGNQSTFYLAPRNVIFPCWGCKAKHMSWSLNMVHFHSTLSLQTPQLQMWFPFPMVQLLDEFQGALNLNGHNNWSLCEATLVMYTKDQILRFICLMQQSYYSTSFEDYSLIIRIFNCSWLGHCYIASL
jgi:hypothetical protein